MIPQELKQLADALSFLPGIGPRQALRLAFYITREGKKDIELALLAMNKVRLCTHCFFPHALTGELCSICKDSHRTQPVIAIVEKETDLISIENSKSFSGTYFILGELQKNGLLETSHRERLLALTRRIAKLPQAKAKELIIALSPTTNGDLTTSQLLRELAPYAEKITRLGRGIPIGGEVEFADEETLGEALKNRG